MGRTRRARILTICSSCIELLLYGLVLFLLIRAFWYAQSGNEFAGLLLLVLGCFPLNRLFERWIDYKRFQSSITTSGKIVGVDTRINKTDTGDDVSYRPAVTYEAEGIKYTIEGEWSGLEYEVDELVVVQYLPDHHEIARIRPSSLELFPPIIGVTVLLAGAVYCLFVASRS